MLKVVSHDVKTRNELGDHVCNPEAVTERKNADGRSENITPPTTNTVVLSALICSPWRIFPLLLAIAVGF